MIEELKDTSLMRHSDIVVAAISLRRWWHWLSMWDALCIVPVIWLNMYGHRVRSSIVRCVIEFISAQALVRYTFNCLLTKTDSFSPKTLLFFSRQKFDHLILDFCSPNCDYIPSSSVSLYVLYSFWSNSLKFYFPLINSCYLSIFLIIRK